MPETCPVSPFAWGDAIGELIDWNNPPQIGPESRTIHRLSALDFTQLCQPLHVADNLAANACLSGLWLWYDELDRSHEISQSLLTHEGSYWHGIMHRREQDYANAKYWFRKVGRHAIHQPLAEWAERNLDEPALRSAVDLQMWNPDLWVELCQTHAHSAPDIKRQLMELAAAEWVLLFDHCFQMAIGRA